MSLLDRLPDGRELYLHVDEAANTFAVVEKVPARTNTAIARAASEIRGRQRSVRGNTQNHIQQAAKVPTWLHEKWRREMGVHWEDKQLRREYENRHLNSIEYRDIRTGGGRL